MQLDEQRVTQIRDVFKSVFEYKELAKGHNASAASQLKGLAESMSADKKEQKEIKKLLKKAYSEWKDEAAGEESSLQEVIDIVEKISAT